MDLKLSDLSDRAPAALSPRPRVAYMLSMVFEEFRPESPEANVAAWERPCLELVQPEAAGGSSSSICSKHGFLPTKLQLIWPKNRNRAYRTYCPQGVACSTYDKYGL